jgi:hypothetical protein
MDTEWTYSEEYCTGSFVTWKLVCMTAASFTSPILHHGYSRDRQHSLLCSAFQAPRVTHCCGNDVAVCSALLVGLTGAAGALCRRRAGRRVDENPRGHASPTLWSWIVIRCYAILHAEFTREKRGGNPNRDCYLDVVKGLLCVLDLNIIKEVVR